MIRLLMTVGFALVTTQAFAQVAVPKSYVDGEVIHADELNTNLEAIAALFLPETAPQTKLSSGMARLGFVRICHLLTLVEMAQVSRAEVWRLKPLVASFWDG